MANQDNKIRIKSVKKSAVMHVYSGKPGCMCGCIGNHRYATKHAAQAGENRGYAVASDEISNRSVSIIVGKINKALASTDREYDGIIEVNITEKTVYVETLNRCYAAFFTV